MILNPFHPLAFIILSSFIWWFVITSVAEDLWVNFKDVIFWTWGTNFVASGAVVLINELIGVDLGFIINLLLSYAILYTVWWWALGAQFGYSNEDVKVKMIGWHFISSLTIFSGLKLGIMAIVD